MERLTLGEPADESDWRALVERGLKGAGWERLTARTADGIAIQPLYREPDLATSTDVSGYPGAAPFIRGEAGWTIRQAFDHPDPERTNHDILADLQGGVGGIELVIDPTGEHGIAIRDDADLDLVLAEVILEAAPVSLDASGVAAAELLAAKLKGVAAPGTAFNLDPIGSLMRKGGMGRDDLADAAKLAARLRKDFPAATALRIDARPVHEAGGTEAQEIAAALSTGIAYLRALGDSANAGALSFAIAIGPDVLLEAAKLRALRLCWARVLEASGAAPEARAAHIHAFTSRRMMTRYDAWTNILRVTTAAFAASIGGADAITTRPLTDALGLPTPFARRVARNTQHVLMEECRLGHVADPAGGAWFVEKLTRDLADAAWSKMQAIEAQGGIVAALTSGALQSEIAEAHTKRQSAFARRKETITGVTDYPLLGAKAPEVEQREYRAMQMPAAPVLEIKAATLSPIRWAEPFEVLRDCADRIAGKMPAVQVFVATLGPLTEFGPRAQFARNLFGIGGVSAMGDETEHASLDALIAAFKSGGARIVALCGADARYMAEAEPAARALKAAGCDWLVLAGKPGEHEAALRDAGVDQFVFVGQDVLAELQTLHAALGLVP